MTCRVLFGLWLGLGFSSGAFAQNLFQKIPPGIQRGMEAYNQERFEEAHEAFEAAQREMPSNAQLEFNRGTTFFKQEKYQEALQSLSRAREWDDGKLQGDIFYNMGNAYAAMGKAEEAMASYRQALRVNPEDSMARNNLEFLLAQPPPPPPPPQPSPEDEEDSEEEDKPDGADTHNSPPQADTQPGEDSKHNEAKEEAEDKSPPQEGPPKRQGKQLSREEADKILDAFGRDEKGYEPWRFQQKPPVEAWQYEQDW